LAQAGQLPGRLRAIIEQEYPRFSESEMQRRRGLMSALVERAGVGQGDDEAIRLLRDPGVDQLAHGNHVEGWRRVVGHARAGVPGGLVDAFLDHRPERVGGLAVGDHSQLEGSVRSAAAGRRAGLRAGAGLEKCRQSGDGGQARTAHRGLLENVASRQVHVLSKP